MDMTRPCSCQGNNERCYKCDGTGYLPGLPAVKPLRIDGVVTRQPTLSTRCGAFTRRVFKSGLKGLAPIQQPQQVTASQAPIMLYLPDGAERPPHLDREGIRFTRCDRCGFYVVSARFVVHDEACVHRRMRPQLPVYSAPSQNKLPKPQDRVACHYCRTMVNAKNMARHLRRSHGLELPQQPQIARTATVPAATSATLLRSGMAAGYLLRDGLRYTRCSGCGKDIRSERFFVHIEICTALSKHRKLSAFSQTKSEQLTGPLLAHPRAGQPAVADAMTACEVCGCVVGARNLERHHRRSHAPIAEPKSRKAASTPNAKPKVRREVSAPKTILSTTTVQRGASGLMDASRFIGYLARDNGSFGSMPSYDDYSDEGSPD